MDTKGNNGIWEAFFEEEEEDTLSLCDLVNTPALHSPKPDSFSSTTPQEFFEFSNELLILSRGDAEEKEEEELNEYQKRDYLTMVKSHSFRQIPAEEPTYNKASRFSSSRSQSTTTHSFSSYTNHKVQNVNISTLTSMSAKSRRRMFMFGPVKFNPEMELSAIKERQGRRLTTLLSPPAVLDGGKAVAHDGRKRRSSSSSHWGVVKSSLRCRAHLSNVLTRSFVFGCIPAAASSGGAGNWIKVAT